MSSSTLDDFEVLGQLGKGSYGTVFKVRRKVDDRIYVLKQIQIGSLSLKEQRDCVVEVRLLASIESPHVVRYYDSFLQQQGDQPTATTLNIVMEFCAKGDLQQRLKRQQGELLPESTIWRYLIQAALGLHHLHSKHILHRDVKAANLMLTEDDSIRIGDLGVAKLLSESQGSFAHTTVGTPYYLSPELCEGKPYNAKSDVWALGVVLFELCTLRHPFDAANQGALILKIIRGRYPPLPAVYAATKLQRVLDAMLRKDTALRPSITQVLASASVYSKARALGIAMPPEVEALVESRKQAPPPATRPAGGRTQPLEGAHVVAPLQAPELVPPAARGALARTTRKTRVRVGASTVGASGAAVLPVICGAAPARPTPHGRPVPARKAPSSAAGKKPRAIGAPVGSGGVQTVRDLPDVVPGALLAAGPPPPLHTHQPGSFIPSPQADSSDHLSFPTAHAHAPVPFSAPPAAALSSSSSASAKPSVSAFKHALGTAPLTHEFGVSPLSSSRSTVSAHAAHSSSVPVDDPDSYEDHDDAYGSSSSQTHSNPSVGDMSEDDYIAATLAQLELEEEALGGTMDADLVDSSHDGDDVLSGSADEVRWRIIEGEGCDDDHDDQEKDEREEPQLYDDDEEEEPAAPAGAFNHTRQPLVHASALDASQPFGIGASTGSSSVSAHPHSHNNTRRPSSAASGGHGRPHAHPDASQVFHAVQERAHKLRAQIAGLVAQLEQLVSAANFATLHEYFKVQAASDSHSAGGGAGTTASSSPPPSGSPSGEHAFVLSLVRVEDMDACITKIYQLLYLEEEADKCAHILALAAAAATAGKRDGRASAATAGASAPTHSSSAALNMTPRPSGAADVSPSNLTIQRRQLLQPRWRAATAAAAVPATNSTAATPAAAAAPARPRPSRSKPSASSVRPPASSQLPLSHTLAPAVPPARNTHARQPLIL